MTACATCGQENPEGFKFCGGCGASLAAPTTVECPSCGQENPAGFKFCGACGADLTAAPEPAPEEERKVVTALFTDIVGSTARAESLDPEDVRAMLAPYYARLRTELERYGGTVEKFIGDAVVALFGAPVAHEDDPERAVRAALAINEAVQELNESDSWLDLHIRTAVHTGEALVVVGARAVEGEGMAAGDVMNTAARLQGGAPVDGIAVGEATYRATQHVIEYVEGEAVAAKGKSEPIPIWVVVGEKATPERPSVRTPLIGRREELAHLSAIWQEVIERQQARLATVVGPPGIGKSRLLLALCEHVEEAGSVHWGRCLSYGEGMTYWPVIEIVKSAAGIRHDDDPGTDSDKLGRLLEELPTSDEDELRTMAAALSNLIGVATTPRGTYSAEVISQAELHWGIRRVLELLARRRPLLLVFEDLHWAEPTLLELLEAIAGPDGDAPLLVLGSTRPELAETHPGFMARSAALELRPLAEAETEELLGELLAGKEFAGGGWQRLLENAAGNPLFLEETVRMVADSPPDEVAADLGALRVPENLQALIGSRLDTLPAPDKRVAQQASVVGATFWPAAVGHIGGLTGDLQPSLETLERREFVHAHPDSTIAGEREYAFKHILIRDVAYERLPKGRRAELHVRFVEWLTELGSEDEFVEIEAYHLEQACLHARAVARAPVEPPVLPAADALSRAGEKAARRESIREADRFFTRALELVGNEHPEVEIELLLRRSRTLGGIGELSRAVELLIQVTNKAQAVERLDLRGAALVTLSSIDLRLGRMEEARQRLLEGEELASQIGERPLQVKAGYELANVYANADGNADKGVEKLDHALSIAEEIDDRPLRVEGHLRRGFLLFNMGELARSEKELLRCTELAGDLGSRRDEARATYLLALAKYYRGDLDEAERLGLQARDWLDRTGETFFQIQNFVALAIYALARGDIAAAEDRLRAAIPLALEESTRVIEVYRYLAEALVLQGKAEEATELAEFAGRSLPEGDVFAKATARLTEAFAATGRGETDEAVAAFADAVSLYDKLSLTIEAGQAQIAFGRALRALGDDARAAAELTSARERFAQTDATGLVAAIESELEELASGAGKAGPARAALRDTGKERA